MKKHYIIVCSNEEQNELVQIKILSKGYSWSHGLKLICYKDKPVLIFDNLNNKNRSISYHEKLMGCDYKIHSCYQKHETVEAVEFLKLKKF